MYKETKFEWIFISLHLDLAFWCLKVVSIVQPKKCDRPNYPDYAFIPVF